MKLSLLTFFGSLLLLAFTMVSADDTFRCGGKIIEVGDAREDVLEHCGKPTSEEGWTWTYERGAEKFTVRVHFDADGSVNRIEEGDGI